MRVKDGASIALLQPALRLALEQVEACYAAFGAECVVTSGDERTTTHAGQPVEGGTEDPHYEGRALDLRLHHVPEFSRAALVARIRQDLGEGYVVLWEGAGTLSEHLHLQLGKVARA
jgi:hypothetical protein